MLLLIAVHFENFEAIGHALQKSNYSSGSKFIRIQQVCDDNVGTL